jgi:hypothetical protein
MDFKELLQIAIGVCIGVILANVISKKVLKMDTWEESYESDIE